MFIKNYDFKKIIRILKKSLFLANFSQGIHGFPQKISANFVSLFGQLQLTLK